MTCHAYSFPMVVLLPATTQLISTALTNLASALRMITVYTIAAGKNRLVACTGSRCAHKRSGVKPYQTAC